MEGTSFVFEQCKSKFVESADLPVWVCDGVIGAHRAWAYGGAWNELGRVG